MAPTVALTLASVITLAQTANSAVDLAPYSQFGLLGLVLGWLMWRVERRLDEIRREHEEVKSAWNRVGKAIVLLALSQQGDDGLRHEGERLLREFGDTP